MANWIPVSKKTGIEYPPVNDAIKAEMESDAQTKGLYRFKAVPQDSELPKAAPKPKQEKTPLKPIGIDSPDEPNQEKEQA